MRILVITNLYPPHTAGSLDRRCEVVVENLKLRGHIVRVLTSTQGLRGEQCDEKIERRLRINGAFGNPAVDKLNELKQLELHNHAALVSSARDFQPDVIHVWSLSGISKSLVYGLRNLRIPTVFDVADEWIATEIAFDRWLRFWNSPSLSFLDQSNRAAQELSGERGRLDLTAPTRLMKGYDRLPELFGNHGAPPGGIAGFVFERIYFCSDLLRQRTFDAGFRVAHAEIIHPFVETSIFVGEIKQAIQPTAKYLVAGKLDQASGALSVVEAVVQLIKAKIRCSLTIYGKGSSAYIAQLRSLAVSNGLPIEFLSPFSTVKDLINMYQKHDVLIFPAEVDEPFPTPALEAMACGVPVICSDSGAARELIRHGENGLLYEAGNPLDLAHRMREIQLQPALRIQMAETAQGEALGRYNESTITDQIENYLTASIEYWVHASQ